MIYLASNSPRRKQLLKQINVEFECVKIDVSEEVLPGEVAADYVVRIAVAKARAGYEALNERHAVVLGADTAVVFADTIMGKPKDKKDAMAMLSRLSGQTHQVYSAVSLITEDVERTELSVSEVTFREISKQERELYWASGEPQDKAGAYAIQGLAAIFISNITGSYSGVMGLPLYETGRLLETV